MSYEDAYYTLGLNKDDAPLVVYFYIVVFKLKRRPKHITLTTFLNKIAYFRY